MALEAVAGAAVSALIGAGLKKVESYGLEFLGAKSELKAGVEKLKDSLRMIKEDILDNAEIKKPGSLASLKDAAYDAEDVLDELEYERLKRQVTRLHRPFKFLESSFLNRVNEIQARLDHILSTAQKIASISRRLNNSNQVANSPNSRETSSLADSDQLFGRGKEKDTITKWLLNATEQSPLETQNGSSITTDGNARRETPVLPIFGMGGIGKTTLAQHVFNNDGVTAHFDIKAWVYVSQNFDEKKIIKDALASFESGNTEDKMKSSDNSKHTLASFESGNIRDKTRYTDNDTLEVLQKALINTLEGNRFLVVLDDIWNENPENWDKIKKYFKCGGLGSKILVTCRTEKVAKLAATPGIKVLQLHALDDDQVWLLLRKHAIGDDCNSNGDMHNFETIGRKIAKKLKGSPLAAKTIGQILKSNLCDRHWMSILESELWNLELSENTIMCALLLSYQHLPNYLKPCFTFSSLIPKGWTRNKHSLIHMWDSQGLVQSNDDGKDLYCVGMEYINELLNRSLFEPVIGEKEHVNMHDLIYDMARIVSKDDIFVITDDKCQNIPKKIRHLSIFPGPCHIDWSMIISGMQYKCLRSLMIDLSYYGTMIHSEEKDLCKFLDKIAHETKYLRLLYIKSIYITGISLPIHNLKLLRYINIIDCVIGIRPSSLCCHYHLQYLWVFAIQEKVLIKLRNLPNLRFIYSENIHVDCIGRLHFMVTLTFTVSKAKGHTIKELANLNELHYLEIYGLENVSGKEEAVDAKLYKKKYLADLRLRWSLDESLPSSSSSNHEQVLEGLRPSGSISELTIERYEGAACPGWMASDQLPNLREMDVYNCSQLNAICASEKVYGNIQRLWLDNCRQLRGSALLQNDDFFPPCLKVLVIRGCGKFGNSLKPVHLARLHFLEKLSLEGCAGIEYIPTEALRSLVELEVDACEKLSVEKGNPLGFGSLTSVVELRVYECNKLLDALVMTGGAALPPSLKDLYINEFPQELFFPNSVRRLQLHNSDKLQWVPIEVFRSVDRIKISACPNLCPPKAPNGQLESMNGSKIKRFYIREVSIARLKEWLLFLQPSKLATLKIGYILELNSFTAEGLDGIIAGMHSLTSLRLKDMDNLESLPATLSNHSSLRSVKIEYCPTMKTLSASMLPNSTTLDIVDCPELLKRLPKKEFIEIESGRYVVNHQTGTSTA